MLCLYDYALFNYALQSQVKQVLPKQKNSYCINGTNHIPPYLAELFLIINILLRSVQLRSAISSQVRPSYNKELLLHNWTNDIHLHLAKPFLFVSLPAMLNTTTMFYNCALYEPNTPPRCHHTHKKNPINTHLSGSGTIRGIAAGHLHTKGTQLPHSLGIHVLCNLGGLEELFLFASGSFRLFETFLLTPVQGAPTWSERGMGGGEGAGVSQRSNLFVCLFVLSHTFMSA